MIPEHLRAPSVLLAVCLILAVPWFMLVFWTSEANPTGAGLGFIVGVLVIVASVVCVGGIGAIVWMIERADNRDRWYRERERRLSPPE